MTRLLIGAAGGLVVGFILATAVLASHADTVDAEVLEAAAAAGVNPVDLAGAINTTGQDPFDYLRGVGELPLPPVSVAPRLSAPVTARVACLEAAESRGRNIANLHGSGAVGVLQYFPSTFTAHAAEMGHADWSPWNPAQARAVAAWDLAHGRRAQWTVSGC